MIKGLKFQKMMLEDIVAVHTINLEAYKDDPEPIEWFNEGITNPQGYYYTAYIDDELVGYFGMYHNTSTTPHYCKIATLAIRPDFQRRGIGRAMMTKMLDIAKSLGLDRAKLEVDVNNPALKLYSDMGFKIKEHIENYYDDTGDDAYIMWCYFAL